MVVELLDEEAIFKVAVEIPAEDARSTYLQQVCGDDQALLDRVLALLRVSRESKDFLESPPGGFAITAPITAAFTATPGTQFGPYKILDQIGEGGMGVVYAAEQTAPVRRKVALKIIRPGMDTRQVIARFEAERQALAMMDHPNIAKVYDAGATENGRSYFVMELVQGVPITGYCDECNLTTRERLELLVTVCQAIQHAHQKGIIHRDIKPSNVLVAMQDGKPAPKIIDFGVAKAIEQRLTEHTLTTAFAQMIGSPLYMSPEQAELSPLGVDTRSDIYSLGVLLYELLAGTTPFDQGRLHAANYDELRRIIRDEEPPRPSTRISTLAVDQATTIAECRRTDARRLCQHVRGELDWIVMKALEKDRNRRYETAISFADDVERYLRDEPVQACPPAPMNRFRKFARRNRAALAAMLTIGAALLLLVAGLAVSNRTIAASRNETANALHQKERALAAAEANAEEADAQRRRAEQSSRKALTAVRDLLISPAISHTEWNRIEAPLRRKFRNEAAKFYATLLQDGSADASLRFETAVGQRALGYLYQQTEGADQAVSLFRQSVEILEGLSRQSPHNLDYRRQLALSHFNLFQTLQSLRQLEEAEASARRAIDLYETLFPHRTDLPSFANEAYGVFVRAGNLLDAELARPDDAERMYRRAIELHELDAARAEPFIPSERAKAYEALARIRIRAGRLKEAADFYSSRMKVAPDFPWSWYHAAALYLAIGDMDRYRDACRELLDRSEALAANRPEVADWAAKTCALSPGSVPDFSRVEWLAERCVNGTERHPWHRNFILTKALVDFRGGRYEPALQQLRQFAPNLEGTHVDAAAFAALALVNRRLGHADQMRDSLDAAQKIIANKPANAMHGSDWFDWLHCEVLYQEIRELTVAGATNVGPVRLSRSNEP
jgi:serine/threonine protein kinase